MRRIPAPTSWVLLLAALAASLFDARAAAQESGALYVGGNFGYALSSYGRKALDDALTSNVNSAGDALTLDAAFVHDKEGMWSADLGYMMSPNFSVEASYLDLETLKYFASGTEESLAAPYLGPNPLATKVDISSRGPALALIGVLPMTNDWYVSARAGAYEGKTTSDYRILAGTSLAIGSESASSTTFLAGAGTTYVLGAHWMLRLDYLYLNQIKEKLLGQSFNVSLVMAGVAYVF